MSINITNRNKILNYFNDHFLSKLKECSENVRGFSYLFLNYWINIFNNNMLVEEGKEPGPKKFLSLMSRTPLSQIYDKNLSAPEKEEFKQIFNNHIVAHGKSYEMREYYDYNGNPSNAGNLTLADWYNSIIHQSHRKKRILSLNGASVEYSVDELSPPVDLENYSMGLVHIDSTGIPLIEGRSYAKLKFRKKNIDIDNVKDFISEEADWFFKEIR